ncbi:class I SAM-dependent methyltransferase [Brachybacterium timonense]|uniref:class I SAM-dependent methyltransferase n=1 Tax=Brachybacterium timonense TaxID=2050896 RepID=UPI000D0BA897|nr:class I SAM-dependent methyltransferase [Brachybacterium timonense]
MTVPEPTIAAYAARAAEYTAALGRIEATAVQDRATIAAWALACPGRVIDAGCGPGHWTAWLHSLGVEVEGVDPVPAFIETARAAHPGVVFRHGTMTGLSAGEATGVLAWYSLIHVPPTQLPAQISALHDALVPAGRLLLGFFAGDRTTPFEHAVTTAWYWRPGEICALLEQAGFVIDDCAERQDPGSRRHGEISAHRPSDVSPVSSTPACDGTPDADGSPRRA